MAKNNLISLHAFGKEIGLLGFDENRGASFFQYHINFLQDGAYSRMFPLIFRSIPQTQVFDKYNNDTFRGLPPMIADSLPDVFGNRVFKTWMQNNNLAFDQISVLEQLTYVGRRGMGALEYIPAKEVSSEDKIDLTAITEIVKQVLDSKTLARAKALDHASLLSIFKIGTSAGGVRPKILVSQHKTTGIIIPGDIDISAEYDHYLVKLGLDDASYSKELIEYAYYLAATAAGVVMMPSKMIDGRHFATLRFDRQEGKKMHILTATGIAGLNYKDPQVSSYERLFDLLIFLKAPHRDVIQLFKRMVFNLSFANHDDHLKNHAFIYNEQKNTWALAPAYDLTYSLNPELNFTSVIRALSVNGKRIGITTDDLAIVAEKYAIKNLAKIYAEVHAAKEIWSLAVRDMDIPAQIVSAMQNSFAVFE